MESNIPIRYNRCGGIETQSKRTWVPSAPVGHGNKATAMAMTTMATMNRALVSLLLTTAMRRNLRYGYGLSVDDMELKCNMLYGINAYILT
jgi:hypothetical protein